MANAYLAPGPIWTFLMPDGTPVANGYVFTFRTGTRIPQATYLDTGKVNPQQNPVRLNANGGAIIYWDTTDYYYHIEVWSSGGQKLGSFDPYPITEGDGGGSVTVINAPNNYARNEQFLYWNQGTSFLAAALPAAATPIADEWYFTRGNTNATIAITREEFSPGQTDVPGTPVYYLEYECTLAAADTENFIWEPYGSVETLNNQEITIGFWGRTRDVATSSTVTIVVQQYFGTGGSTTVNTLSAKSIDENWDFYSATLVVPTIAGKTLGDGNQLRIGFRFQINQVIAVDIVNIQIQEGEGTGESNFPYRTPEEQLALILPYELSHFDANQGTDIIAPTGKTQYDNLTEYLKNIRQQNILVGWDFKTNPNQFGRVIDNSTTPSNGNGFYIADQVILVSDGNNIVKKTSWVGDALRLEVVTENKKFGIFTIIEGKDSSNIQSEYVSLLGLMAADNDVNVKMAVIGWSGTVNESPRACVSAWGVAGTNPTLAAGYTYEAVTDAIALDSSSLLTPQILEAIELSSKDNFGVLVWTDNMTLVAGEELIFERISLVKGRTSYDTGLENYCAVLEKCQRYLWKTYPLEYDEFEGFATSAEESLCVNFNHAFSPVYEISTDTMEPAVLGYPTVPGVAATGLTIYLVTPHFTYGESEQRTTTYFADFAAQSIGVRLPVEMLAPPSVDLFNPLTGDPDEFRWEVDYSHTGTATINFHRIVSSSTPSGGTFTNTFDANTNASFISSNTQEVVIATPDRVQFGAGRNDSNPGTGTFSITSLPRAYVHIVARSLLGV